MGNSGNVFCLWFERLPLFIVHRSCHVWMGSSPSGFKKIVDDLNITVKSETLQISVHHDPMDMFLWIFRKKRNEFQQREKRTRAVLIEFRRLHFSIVYSIRCWWVCRLMYEYEQIESETPNIVMPFYCLKHFKITILETVTSVRTWKVQYSEQ